MSKKRIESVEPESTALTVLSDQGYTVVQYQPEDLREMIAENMGGELQPSDLQRIRVPSGGGKAWEVVDENGEAQAVKTISGVVLMARTQRAYWAEDFGGGNEPPDCASLNGAKPSKEIAFHAGVLRARRAVDRQARLRRR